MEHEKLEKQLGLWDVFAISTGAMFSSGFFLLPGIAAAETGPSVFLAYFFAGVLVLPTMFSVSELCTAMPRAGGTYYFIDRSLGPVMGTVGGFGSWLALVLKSAFALIGMGAYIGIFIEVPITLVAVVLTIIFGIINIVGAKESSFLQKVLVAALLGIMFFYIVQGLFHIFSLDFFEITRRQFSPFYINGINGVLATIGMVFVSYAGLTKVASIAEEVEDPDKNIPLGMILSLIVAVFVYVVGVYLMVALLEPSALRSDLTPVATAGEVFLNWLPEPTGLVLVVIAAIAAFASTGNAGIMSASRYPMAMGRDKLITSRFSEVSDRYGTPIISIVGTVLLMIFFLIAFDVEAVAKLASAFQLLLFALLNLAVIVMRESKIEEYDPGFNSPFYPWMQIAGMIISVFLILEMGLLSILFTAIIAVFSVGWFYYYGYGTIEREGALYHVHARLGKRRDRGLEHEMRNILREKGLRDEDPYEEVVARSMVIDNLDPGTSYKEIIRKAASLLAVRINIEEDKMFDAFRNVNQSGLIPMGRGVALNHLRVQKDVRSEMVLVRMKEGITMDTDHFEQLSQSVEDPTQKVRVFIFLVSSEKHSGSHLRILAHIAEMIDNRHFMKRWVNAEDEGELREIMLRDERFINLTVNETDITAEMTGKKIKDIELPGKSLIAILKRKDDIIIPHGNTEIKLGDELSIVGEIEDINQLREMKNRSRH
ncbi:amino acid permease [Aliifodinibius sp. S!AR15-10]|uniref:amino acid permease n=1 Tax=Aliifodinibius sp. S!AR15-10 TaxID=2950437 RepID=UPI0028567542|nr:amino acid permease [Aliifodinibius sp. S!AR15-10]MDR8392194.1 amino acid permease [Aliifodinibius sp. S!AR15-10]